MQLSKFRIVGRIVRRFVSTISNFPYDIKRWYKFGGWYDDGKIKTVTEYRALMVAHGVEKGLSYLSRDPARGGKRFNDMHQCLTSYSSQMDDDVVSILRDVEQQYLNKTKNGFRKTPPMNHGSVTMEADIQHKFFKNRRSQRSFSTTPITFRDIEKIVDLAKYTPSVCNRQTWKIYYSLDKEIVRRFLKFQSGNKPWAENLQSLLVVTVDQHAFFGGNERYQHYIEGGLISMQLLNAIHSEKLAACALNWSQFSAVDKKVRKEFNIEDNHSIIMCIALGHHDKEYIPCTSSRRETANFMKELK